MEKVTIISFFPPDEIMSEQQLNIGIQVTRGVSVITSKSHFDVFGRSYRLSSLGHVVDGDKYGLKAIFFNPEEENEKHMVNRASSWIKERSDRLRKQLIKSVVEHERVATSKVEFDVSIKSFNQVKG